MISAIVIHADSVVHQCVTTCQMRMAFFHLTDTHDAKMLITDAADRAKQGGMTEVIPLGIS